MSLAATTGVMVGGSACSKRAPAQASHPSVQPVVVYPSSLEMRRKYGIAEWRIFVGRNQVVTSGYGTDGKTKRGYQLAWFGHTATSAAHLRVVTLGGTREIERRMAGGKETGRLSFSSIEVMAYAARDLRVSMDVENAKWSSVQVGGRAGGGGLRLLDDPSQSAACAQAKGQVDMANSVTCTALMGATGGAMVETGGSALGIATVLGFDVASWNTGAGDRCKAWLNEMKAMGDACGCKGAGGFSQPCPWADADGGAFFGPRPNMGMRGNKSATLDASPIPTDDGGTSDDGNANAGSTMDDGATADDGGTTADDSGTTAPDDGGTTTGDDGGTATGDDGGAVDPAMLPTESDVDDAAKNEVCPSCSGGAQDISVDENGTVTAQGSQTDNQAGGGDDGGGNVVPGDPGGPPPEGSQGMPPTEETTQGQSVQGQAAQGQATQGSTQGATQGATQGVTQGAAPRRHPTRTPPKENTWVRLYRWLTR